MKVDNTARIAMYTILTYIALVCNACVLAQATNTDYSWTGKGGDSNWNNAGNWSGGIPTSSAGIVYAGKTVYLGNGNETPYDIQYNGDFVSKSQHFAIGRTTDATVSTDYGLANFTINGNAEFAILRVGINTAGTFKVVNPDSEKLTRTVTIGHGNVSDYFWVGSALDNAAVSQTAGNIKPSVADFSQVTNVNIDVNRFTVAGRNDNYEITNDVNTTLSTNGPSNYKFNEGANVILGTNNNIKAKYLVVASSFGANLQEIQTTLEFGEGTNTLQVANMVVGGKKAEAGAAFSNVGHLASIREGGTFSLVGQNGAGTKANLYIADNTEVNTSNLSKSTFDLSNASSVSMDLGVLRVGCRSALHGTIKVNHAGYRDGRSGGADGTLKLGDNAQVSVDDVVLANMDIYYRSYSGSRKATATIDLGGESKITAQKLTSGNNFVTKWQFYDDNADQTDPANIYWIPASVSGNQSTSNLNFNAGGTLEVTESFTTCGKFNVNFSDGGSISAPALTSDGYFTVTGTNTSENNVQGVINIEGEASFSGASYGKSPVTISNAIFTAGSLKGTAGAASSFFNLTIKDNAKVTAGTLETSGTTNVFVGSAGNLADASSLNIDTWISNDSAATFTLYSGTVKFGSIEFLGIAGQTDPVFKFLGGKLIVDEIDITAKPVQPVAAFSVMSALSASDNSPNVLKVLSTSANTDSLHQNGANSVLSPGDDGVCGKTLITGNYILDSGAIRLDALLDNQDVLCVDGSVSLGNDSTVTINVSLMETNSNAALFMDSDLSLMLMAAEETPLGGVTPASDPFETILLLSANEINFDGLTADQWGDSHVTGLSSDYNYQVVPTSTLAASLQSLAVDGNGNMLPNSLIATLNANEEPVTVLTVPEPSSYLLITLGVAGLYILSRRTRRA